MKTKSSSLSEISSPHMKWHHPPQLETISTTIHEINAPLFEQIFTTYCQTTSLVEKDEKDGLWIIEGIKIKGDHDDEIKNMFLLICGLTGEDAKLSFTLTEADGWLEKTKRSFPPRKIGKSFLIKGEHIDHIHQTNRHIIKLDAGVAFGSGEHETTRGCIEALEKIAFKKPHKIMDMGCGSGILAIAATKLLKQQVVCIDVDPWSIKTTLKNAKLNKVLPFIKCFLGNGWHTKQAVQYAPYDLIFANILARPLCKMAPSLAKYLTPGGTAILSGLLDNQARMVIDAHKAQGLIFQEKILKKQWATLIFRKPNSFHK